MMVVHNHERGDEPLSIRDEREVELARKWNALLDALYAMREECTMMIMCSYCPAREFCRVNEIQIDAFKYPDDWEGEEDDA